MNKWDERYFSLAIEISKWSKDPSRKFGAVIVGNHGQVISQGYNGFPRFIDDSIDKYNDRTTKYKYIVHAEANAIYNAALTGVSTNNTTMYVAGGGLMICHECAKAIIQSGIKKVCVLHTHNSGWEESAELAKDLFAKANIEYKITWSVQDDNIDQREKKSW